MSQSLTRCSSIKKCVDMRKRKMKETPLDFTYLTYKEALFYSQLLCWAQHRTYNPPLSSLHLDMIAPNTLAEYLDIETKLATMGRTVAESPTRGGLELINPARKGINNDDRFNATYVKSMKAAPAADVSLLSMMKICRLSATLEYHKPSTTVSLPHLQHNRVLPLLMLGLKEQAIVHANTIKMRVPHGRQMIVGLPAMSCFLAARKITWIRHLAMISVT
ncbi:hypothetical protein R3P38DRAFT_3240773 [Favolaschia claudopus]|uniref:Uncharacterized protein n=1 Tax=Favolaschia claudopus TaxID=2862362 RepID=A0AAV9Z6U8_9AGAR